MANEGKLPGYQGLLSAYHRAFGTELRQMVETLPLRRGDRVLDLACGDGTYTALLSRRVGPEGQVVAVDLNPAYLALARDHARRAGNEEQVAFVSGSAEELPLPDGRFDLAWCAQSLYSLSEPTAVLSRLRRAVRPGGIVAVLENDTLHQLILPWPIEIELAVRAAELQARTEKSDQPRKYDVARRLGPVYRRAGLIDFRLQTFAHDRQAPLSEDERRFVAEYLHDLRQRAGHRVHPAVRSAFDRLTDPDAPEYLPDSPDLTFTVIDHLVWGGRPEHDEE